MVVRLLLVTFSRAGAPGSSAVLTSIFFRSFGDPSSSSPSAAVAAGPGVRLLGPTVRGSALSDVRLLPTLAGSGVFIGVAMPRTRTPNALVAQPPCAPGQAEPAREFKRTFCFQFAAPHASDAGLRGDTPLLRQLLERLVRVCTWHDTRSPAAWSVATARTAPDVHSQWHTDLADACARQSSGSIATLPCAHAGIDPSDELKRQGARGQAGVYLSAGRLGDGSRLDRLQRGGAQHAPEPQDRRCVRPAPQQPDDCSGARVAAAASVVRLFRASCRCIPRLGPAQIFHVPPSQLGRCCRLSVAGGCGRVCSRLRDRA
jgi:hypothetical protein